MQLVAATASPSPLGSTRSGDEFGLHPLGQRVRPGAGMRRISWSTSRTEVATSRDGAGASSEVLSEAVPEEGASSEVHSEAEPSSTPPPTEPSAPLPPPPPPPPSAQPSAGAGMEANTAASSEALPWSAKLVSKVKAAAEAETASRQTFDSRKWHVNRRFFVSDTLPQDGAAMVLSGPIPTELAVVRVESESTKDVQALRATGSPPPGMSEEQAIKFVMNGGCDERLAITGLRNMFMQSGVPAAMSYELIRVPPHGLCVWLVVALLTARRDARSGTEPHVLTSGAVLDVLRMLQAGVLSADRILPETIAKIEGVDRNASWDQISGERTHCGNIHDACEALAAGWGVHVPVLILARHETLDAFSIAVIVYGDEGAPSIFGSHGGALVTYEALNGSVPLLSHVDMLVSSPQA